MKFGGMLILGLVFATAIAPAQETRWTRVHPSKNAKDDSKPNNPSIPDVYALTGHFDRILVLRCKYKTDLLADLEKMVKQEHIQNGVILAAVGSVRGYEIHQVNSRDFPTHEVFEKNPTEPADLISMNGYIIDGRIHAHITLATSDRAFGGHLEPGTQVFTFAIVTIGVMNKTHLNGVDDATYR